MLPKTVSKPSKSDNEYRFWGIPVQDALLGYTAFALMASTTGSTLLGCLLLGPSGDRDDPRIWLFFSAVFLYNASPSVLAALSCKTVSTLWINLFIVAFNSHVAVYGFVVLTVFGDSSGARGEAYSRGCCTAILTGGFLFIACQVNCLALRFRRYTLSLQRQREEEKKQVGFMREV
ncbi:unnamed protein product, partial [Mesorhabditis spiculigera]